MLKNWEMSDEALIKQGQGLVYQGIVTDYTDSTHFTCAGLAGFGNDFFASTNFSDWEVYALWDAGGTGANPQGLLTTVSEYVSTTGAFTHTAFSSGTLAEGDKVLLVHPILAWLGTKADAAATGAVSAGKTTSAYLKQVLNELLGTDGGWTNLNNGSVASLDVALQKLAAVLAIDSTNTFSATVGGSSRTDIEAAFTALDALIGASTDNGDLATVFAKLKQQFLGTHVHVLLIVADPTSLNADTDTALQAELLDRGYEVLIADAADVAGSMELAFDFIVVSGSITSDTDLGNLTLAECPVITHSAEVAVSTSVFSMGTSAGTQTTETDIEIKVNTVQWLLDKSLANLTVTASATLETMASVSGDILNLAEEATGTGNDITMARLKGGDEDASGISPNFDRYFIGVKDWTNANAVFKAFMAELWEHVVHEVRFSEVVVTPKRVFQEQIPDTAISLASVDTALGSDPPSADAVNSVIDIDKKPNRTFVLRSLFANITDIGGTAMTLQLWVDMAGSPVSVDSKVITATGYYNLMDIFGLQEVYADSIHITAIVNSGTGAISGIYRYAEAKK